MFAFKFLNSAGQTYREMQDLFTFYRSSVSKNATKKKTTALPSLLKIGQIRTDIISKLTTRSFTDLS